MKPISFSSSIRPEPETFRLNLTLGRMAIATGLMAAALIVRWLVDPFLKEHAAIGALYWAVAATVWIAGWQAALIGAVLGLLAGIRLFLTPRGVGDASTHNSVAAVTYALNCAILIGLGEAARRWKARQLRTQHELESRVNELQTLVDILPCGVWVADRKGKTIGGNRAAYQLLGRTPPTDGQPEDDRACEEYRYLEKGITIPYQDMPLQRVARSGKPLTGFEYEIVFPNSESRIIWGNAAPLLDKDGTLRGVIAAAVDFTQRKQVELELARTRDHLEEIVHERTMSLQESEQLRARSERLASVGIFASGIAHELNNPLNSIYLMAQYMLRKRGTTFDPDTVAKIKEEAQRGGQIVKNVLKLAQDQPSPRVPSRLQDCVSQAVELVTSYMDGSRVDVEVEMAPDLPPIALNRIEIEQVILNILKNAVQSTSERIRVRVTAALEGPEEVLLIWNDGPVIPQNICEHLFDAFFTTRRTSGGCGLGLSLCHKIVTDHGGKIDVVSSPEAGTTFRIRLPLEAAPEISMN